MAHGNDRDRLGSPPGAPLPEGLIPLKSGPPAPHPMTAEIRQRGPEWLYDYCQQQGLNEQSTYSFLRSFFRLNFKEFKALAHRAERTSKGMQLDSEQEGRLPPCQPEQ